MSGLTAFFAIAAGVSFALAVALWWQGQQSKRQLAKARGNAAAQLTRLRALESLSNGGFIAWLSDGTFWSRGLYIADNGIGMSETDQSLVFETFREASPSDRQSSVGLGLSLVKRFVELHGGRVDLDSTLGKGTRVTCFLPTRQTESNPTAALGDRD